MNACGRRQAATAPRHEIERLVLRLRERDAAAFERLYDAYYGLVYGVARRILPAPAAEDVTQAAFLKLWTNPEAFRGGNFGGWLARVARNASIDALHRHAARHETLATANAVVDAKTDDLALSEIDGDHVRRALGRLSPKHRQLIELGFYAGISHSEIARITTLPVGTVKTRIRAGLQQLRGDLERLVRA